MLNNMPKLQIIFSLRSEQENVTGTVFSSMQRITKAPLKDYKMNKDELESSLTERVNQEVLSLLRHLGELDRDILYNIMTKCKKSKTNQRVKNGVFWDVTPCGSRKNRRLGGKCRLHHLFLRSVVEC
jgi:hypothetical protein